MLQRTPESNGLTLPGPLAQPARWAGGMQWLTALLRGAPKFSLLVLTVAVLCAIFAPGWRRMIR